jgi:hypothetical protein
LIVGELVSDHSAISATVQDILHVAVAGGGGANTRFGAEDKANAADTAMNKQLLSF